MNAISASLGSFSLSVSYPTLLIWFAAGLAWRTPLLISHPILLPTIILISSLIYLSGEIAQQSDPHEVRKHTTALQIILILIYVSTIWVIH